MKYPAMHLGCRAIGPGGTMIRLYPTPEGVKAIWVNESCPSAPYNKETYEAEDGHNVEMIPWAEVHRLAALDPNPRRGEPGLHPQPKKQLKRR